MARRPHLSIQSLLNAMKPTLQLGNNSFKVGIAQKNPRLFRGRLRSPFNESCEINGQFQGYLATLYTNCLTVDHSFGMAKNELFDLVEKHSEMFWKDN